MKITNIKTTQDTVIQGEITEADLQECVRATLATRGITIGKAVPLFYVLDHTSSEGRAYIRDDEKDPVHFEVRITGEVPTPIQEPPARCSVGECKFPSLAGGMCASHLSEAHRQRRTYTHLDTPPFPRDAGVPEAAPPYVNRNPRGEPI